MKYCTRERNSLVHYEYQHPHLGNISTVNMLPSKAIILTLSAVESISLPNSVACLRNRVILPSATSVQKEIVTKTAAIAIFCVKIVYTMGATSASLEKLSRFGRVRYLVFLTGNVLNVIQAVVPTESLIWMFG